MRGGASVYFEVIRPEGELHGRGERGRGSVETCWPVWQRVGQRRSRNSPGKTHTGSLHSYFTDPHGSIQPAKGVDTIFYCMIWAGHACLVTAYCRHTHLVEARFWGISAKSVPLLRLTVALNPNLALRHATPPPIAARLLTGVLTDMPSASLDLAVLERATVEVLDVANQVALSPQLAHKRAQYVAVGRVDLVARHVRHLASLLVHLRHEVIIPLQAHCRPVVPLAIEPKLLVAERDTGRFEPHASHLVPGAQDVGQAAAERVSDEHDVRLGRVGVARLELVRERV